MSRGFAWLGWIALSTLLLVGLGLAVYIGQEAWSAPGWELWGGRREAVEKVRGEGAGAGVEGGETGVAV